MCRRGTILGGCRLEIGDSGLYMEGRHTTMKRASFAVLLMLGLGTLAFGGKIYGSITEGGKAVGQNVKVEVTCGSNTYSAQTDAHGSFELFVPDKGNCTLKVYYQCRRPA